MMASTVAASDATGQVQEVACWAHARRPWWDLYLSGKRDPDGLAAQGFAGQLNFADCTAALIPWRDALQAPHRILFSGPAAGAASCVALGRAIGDGNLIGCDVGGTSTDVTMIVDGKPFTNDSFELEWDLVVNALATEVASVGAGGGSLVGWHPRARLPGQMALAMALPGMLAATMVA
jgi:N-methylhydantoinase A